MQKQATKCQSFYMTNHSLARTREIEPQYLIKLCDCRLKAAALTAKTSSPSVSNSNQLKK